MTRVATVFGFWVLLLAPLWGAPASIPEAEVLTVPGASRLGALHAAAQRDGWWPQRAALQAAAIRAYERDRLPAAEAWLNLLHWAEVFGETEAEFIPRWAEAVQSGRVGHANMPTQYATRARPLAASLSPALQAWLIGNAPFSAEFFELLSPVDRLPRVFEILDELFRADAAKFKAYANLALAIALVYDVPPPPFWPHAQVTAEALPRQFPDAAAAFGWWTRQDQQGRTFHRLARLGADELKFVVDSVAPFAELEWVQGACDLPLAQLPRAYALVRYRNDRIAKPQPIWPGQTYALRDILAAGGICADQAYFAAMAGKARGVPTLIFAGAGNDGRHAWFGYLDAGRKWHLDAGRYAEQRFVTGFARDPQTWREFSDHELQFLTERFRELPSFRQSHAHEAFAAEYLAADNAAAAAAAARKAVNYERRNQNGWELLVAAARQEGRDTKTIENLWREAALAFQRYPDLEAAYVNRVAESLRARGETSAADAEVRRIANKNHAGRNDLSILQARDIVRRVLETQPLAEQIRTFNTVVDTYGRGAGMGFFDEVVAGFIEHLLQRNQKAEASRAVERARRTLKVEPGSQLAVEFEALSKRIKDAK